MENFKFSYDKEDDNLFIYLESQKSEGAVEMGNFVFDFNKDEDLVAIQIFEASKVLSKIMPKIIELANIKNIKMEIANFRNMTAVRMFIDTDKEAFMTPIIIPKIKQESPAL
ncbi:DUF2283 domain-containing protein [Candidatus Pacearchaeota archaeon]|nr:DUF2283 domain-containing protein [Candidatus Pacearchaeota archaeon]